jgi:hypothetical protein
MSIDRFPGFVVVTSGGRVVFALSETSPPLWVIDTALLAGTPTLSIKRVGTPGLVPTAAPELVPPGPAGKIISRHSLNIALSNARYPGTNIAADLSMLIIEVITQDETTFDVSLNFMFGNAAFSWADQEFAKWLQGLNVQTAQIALVGTVVALQGGGTVAFGPATTGTLRLTPGILTIDDGVVCTIAALGVAATGTSLAVSIPGPGAQSSVVVRSSTPYAVPLPSPTPLGSVTAEAGFNTLSVLATEAGQRVTFASDLRQPLYALELIDGVRDLSGSPARFELLVGQVIFDLTAPVVSTLLRALGSTDSQVLLAGGIGLRVPQNFESAGVLTLQLSLDASGWTVIQATLPLPGLFLPLDDGIAEPAATPGAVLSLVPGTANWLRLGPLPAGTPRLHTEDFAVHLTRPADLLDIEIGSTNIAFEATEDTTPTLGPVQNGQPAFWRVTFPPQHIAEQAFYRGSEQPNLASQGDESLDAPPAAARMAGPTVLAFSVPADVPRFQVTLANLLDWKRYQQSDIAVPLQAPDPIRQTAIELPERLFISPDTASGWSHSITAATDVSELWHSRLALRRPLATGGFVIDERASSSPRQGRAFFSPDSPNPSPDPFKGSLSGDKRDEIVRLSSGSDAFAHTFDIQRLILSALGGTAHFDSGWNPPSQFGLTLWQHETSFGRDQYVRVAERGFLFPYGHRAAKVTVSERRFLPDPKNPPQAVAYLVQFDYIMVTQPVHPYSSLDLPFTEIEFVTRITPTLNQPQSLPGLPPTPVDAFWIFAENVPFLFELAATDLLGRKLRFQAPAIFVQDDSSFEASVAAAAAEYRRRGSFNQPVPFGGQKVAFAPSKDEESTSFETTTLSLDSNVPTPTPAGWKDSNGNPLFRPLMSEATMHHAAAAALAGVADAVQVAYYVPYLQQARTLAAASLDSPVDVFLTFINPPAAKLGADKTGVAAPAYALNAVSRTRGAVGGNPDDIVKGIFKPSSFLRPDAKFLGQIILSEVIGAPSPIPNLNTTVVTAADGTRSSVTTFEWHPPLKAPPAGALQLTFSSGSTLDLTAKVTTQLSAAPAPPSTELHGSVGGFTLDFAGLVALNFTSMKFDSITGKKPSIDVQLDPSDPVVFEGDLEFVNALKKLIPSNGFSPPGIAPAVAAADSAEPANGPFLDVTAAGITAGFSLAIPTVGVGIFSLENLRIGAALTLPFGDKPVSLSFNFAEPDHKFLLTVDLLAGGGYLVLDLDASGVQRLEFAIEFGANVALNLLIATGSAHILAGASLILTKTNTHLTGYLRAGGELTVLGLVSISVDFYLGLSYDTDSGDLYGIASLSVEVSVAYISKSVTLTLERRFAGSGGPHSSAPLGFAAAIAPGAVDLNELLSTDDWAEYAGAFATEG